MRQTCSVRIETCRPIGGAEILKISLNHTIQEVTNFITVKELNPRLFLIIYLFLISTSDYDFGWHRQARGGAMAHPAPP